VGERRVEKYRASIPSSYPSLFYHVRTSSRINPIFNSMVTGSSFPSIIRRSEREADQLYLLPILLKRGILFPLPTYLQDVVLNHRTNLL
jgi:hypothetical protein